MMCTYIEAEPSQAQHKPKPGQCMTALAGERIFCERWYVVRYLLAVRGQVLAQAERVYDSTYRTIYYWGVVRRTVSA